MSMNTELLQFMDGTLAPEQEAELLHRLSVSPERREILRSFFNMKVLFERDRNSIAVPYAAEQKLWASLGQMMPPMVQSASAPAVLETAAITATRTGFFNSAFKVASVAAICLLIGLGSGFYAGKSSNNNVIAESPVETRHGASLLPSGSQTDMAPSTQNTLKTSTAKHSLLFNAAQHHSIQSTEAPLETAANAADADLASNNSTVEFPVNSAIVPQIPTVSPKQIAEGNMVYMHDPSQYTLRIPFDFEEPNNMPHKSFIQKFEFYFNEGIGKQFPNNTATNVSMPVVTNSSISALFQAFANTPGILSQLWGGGSFGTANVTQKKLHLDLDPVAKSYVLLSDPVHVQTTWYGALLEYRMPISRKLAFTVTGTFGNSSVGMLLGGELGIHADVTSDVGLVAGLRGMHISYNVDQQQQDLINQGKTLGLSIPASAVGNQLSYNIEGSFGLYFHF